MRYAAHLACWPLIGLFGFVAIFTDSMIDICEALDKAIESLQEYAEGDA
jgi:hypothetical protein